MAQNVNPTASSAGATPNSKTSEGSTAVSQDGHAVTKRLQRELMNLMMSKEKGISAFPETENIFNWIATIKGPTDTVYEGFTYKLSVAFPVAYPYAPPVVKFITTCFHPNVDLSGTICLDILREQWSPLYDITAVLLSIQSLLGEPNNKSPLNVDAANLWKNQTAYRQYLLKNFGPPEK